MKILVTGGAGFIASHLVDKLIARGDEVTVIDDLSTGKREFVNKEAVFVEGSIADDAKLEEVFKHGPFDLINHHAAQKSVTFSAKDPVADAKINIVGGLKLLEKARREKVERFIFASTGGALYGDGVEIPTPEDAKIEPLSPYGIAKYSLENYLRFYRETGIKTQVLRYANVYGPRQDPQGEAGVVAIFCQKLLSQEDLTVFGDGKQTRDFIFVNDVVGANLAAIDSSKSGVWNIGSGMETSVNEIAEELIKISSSASSKVVFAPARLGELRRSTLNPAKAKKDLGWEAKVSLPQGLLTTFESFKK